MAKVTFFVPYEELLLPAEKIAEEYPSINPVKLKYVKTEQAAQAAVEEERSGCEIIIARGSQAQMVRRAVSLPVVELRASTQSVGLRLVSLRRRLGAERPKIGLIGLVNTLPDTTHYGELFGVELAVYPAEEHSALRSLVERAAEDGCLAVVGANTVLTRAGELGLPGEFLESGEESIRVAYRTAVRVAYAQEEEKKRRVEMNIMLDNTTGGIMQVDADGVVTRVNRAGLRMLGLEQGALVGKDVSRVFPEIDRKAVESFMDQEGIRTYVVGMKTRTLLVNAVPVQVGGAVRGMILTFQEDAFIRQMDSDLRADLYRRGFMAVHTFENFIAVQKETAALVRSARRMAAQESPVLLCGTDHACLDILAECIHNESAFRSNAFITVDCSAYQDEDLDNMLFGNYTTRKDTPQSLVELAENGTLYLKNVEALSLQIQYKLARLTRGLFLHNGANFPLRLKLRLVASTAGSLLRQLNEGKFRSDLYYALHVLKLEIPTLRDRREDIPGWFSQYMSEWEETYHRRFHLTQDARAFVGEYDWPGGLFQMSCVCERLVLLSEKRNIGVDFLRSQIEQVMPRLLPGTDTIVTYKDRKAVEIAALLRQYNGNREKVANALGVSKTTLWRYIKKYGIGPDYSY